MKKLILATFTFYASLSWAQSPQFIELRAVGSSMYNKFVLLTSAKSYPQDPGSEIYIESTFEGAPIKTTRLGASVYGAVSDVLVSSQSYTWNVKAYLQNAKLVQNIKVGIVQSEKAIEDLQRLLAQETDLQKRSFLQSAILEEQQKISIFQNQILSNRKLVETKELVLLAPAFQSLKFTNDAIRIVPNKAEGAYVSGQAGIMMMYLDPTQIENGSEFGFEVKTKFDNSLVSNSQIAPNTFRTELNRYYLSEGMHVFSVKVLGRHIKDSVAIQDAIDHAAVMSNTLNDLVTWSTDPNEISYYTKELDDVLDIKIALQDFYEEMGVEVASKELSLTVSPDSTGFTKIVVGDSSACGIKFQALYCWGLNTYGETGINSVNAVVEPVAVPTMTAQITNIVAGGNHMCAIKGGALYCWGRNSSGQLGIGNTFPSSVPVMVSGMESGVTKVAAGLDHTCALKSGTLYCWGSHAYGQLGAGTGNSTIPRAVNLANVKEVGAGGSSTCASVQSGLNVGLYCWGLNTSGQLGVGNVVNRTAPTVVTGLTTGVGLFSVGGTTTCAIVSSVAKCWGSNTGGMLGNGSTSTYSATAVNVTNFNTGVTQISAGTTAVCGIKSFAPYCWGAGAGGALGNGTVANKNIPTLMTGVASASDVAQGNGFGCLVELGAGKCWGTHKGGNLGHPSVSGNLLQPQEILRPAPLFRPF